MTGVECCADLDHYPLIPAGNPAATVVTRCWCGHVSYGRVDPATEDSR